MHAADGSQLCADIEKNNTGNGTPIQTYTCNGTVAQSWTLGTDNSVRGLGKCLDATSAGTTAGTPIQLYTCNETPALKWVPGAHGALTNPASGLCLTDPGASAGNGTQLVLQTCATAGAPEHSATRRRHLSYPTPQAI